MQRKDLLDFRAWLNPRRKRFWAWMLVACYTLGGFFALPWLIRTKIPELTQQYAQRTAEVGAVHFNPWTLRLQVDGFVLHDADQGELTGFEQLVINLQTRSILQSALVFREISLTRPRFNLTRYAFADTNLNRLLKAIETANPATGAAEETSAELPHLTVDDFTIADGAFRFRDELSAKPFETRLEPININVRDLSTLPDASGAQQISVNTENGASLKWSGSLQLSPLKSAGNIVISGSPVPLLYRYLQDQLNFRLQDCCLDISLDYEVASKPDGNIVANIQNLQLSSRKLELLALENDERVLLIPEIRVSGGSFEWPAQKISIADILIDKPEAAIWIRPDGVLNLDALLPPGAPADATATAQAAGDSKETTANGTGTMTVPSGSKTSPAAAATAGNVPAVAAPAKPAWNVNIAALRVNGMQLVFSDRSLATPGTLSIPQLDLTINNISSQPNAELPFSVNAKIGAAGRFSAQGQARVLPEPVIDAKVEVADFALRDLQPWIEPVAQIEIRDGLLKFAGALESSADEQLAVDGDLDVAQLAISDTQENVPLVGWRRFAAQQVRLRLSKGRLDISRLRFEEPFMRLIIAADGTTNFAGLRKQQTAGTAATSGEAAAGSEDQQSQAALATGTNAASPDAATTSTQPFVVSIAKTRFSDGSMDFADLSLPLPFQVPIRELDGSVDAFATNSQAASAISLEGVVGEYGSVTADGELSTLQPTEQADIAVDFRNISMPDLSPYTVKFAGRKVAAGKLNLDLDYRIDKGELAGSNKIVLEKFKLGERVESPRALDLPLDLAVGLLTDSNGIIDLQLDISGNLGDPAFSAASAIGKVFVNTITKAVTAPFKLLSGLIPGKPDIELDALYFRPGRTKLPPPEREKLGQLATALAQRPQLVLTVPAAYNRELDTRALQARAVNEQLDALLGDATDDEQELLLRRTRKGLEKLADKQLPDVSLRDLRKQFERPQPDSGDSALDEVAYVADLRRQLEAVQLVGTDQLTTLGMKRRDAIMALLQKSAALPAKQLRQGKLVDTAEAADDKVRVALDLSTTAAGPAAPGES